MPPTTSLFLPRANVGARTKQMNIYEFTADLPFKYAMPQVGWIDDRLVRGG